MTEHNLTFDMDMSEYRITIRDRMYLFKSEEQCMKNKRTKKYFQEWPQVLGWGSSSKFVLFITLGIS